MRTIWIPLKICFFLLCVVLAGRYMHAFIDSNLFVATKAANPASPSKPTVSHLSPEVARQAYTIYNASGDLRRDDTKIIQWVHAPDFIRKHASLVPAKCGKSRCAVAHDIRYIEDSHALIFSGEGVEKYGVPDEFLQNRVRIMFDHRPTLQKNINKLKSKLRNRSVFNWTSSYRSDSDIPMSYGKIVEKNVVPLYNLTNVVLAKTKTAVFFQSACKTPGKVEDYLKQLRRYISVDVFGDCQSKYLCSATADVECYTKVGKKYKFYLAFEDALCPDYVTDVFFRYFGTDSVPVVRGGVDYNKMVPKGTFINTANFKSVKMIGKYLKYLDQHDSKYVAYLKEKRNYESQYSHYERYMGKTFLGYRYLNMDNIICDVCHRLWNIDLYEKTYDDIVEWYQRSKCAGPGEVKHV